MNDNKDQDFRQFEGAFDFPMQPDADFTARLTQKLADAQPVEQERRSTVLGSPSRGDVNPPAPRGRHPLFVVAAALLVIALSAATVFQMVPQVLEQDHAAAPEATLPENAVSTPGADVTLNTTRYPELGNFHIEAVDGSVIYGNSYTAEEDTLAPGFYAYDIENQEILWSTEGIVFEQAVVYEDRIMGTRAYVGNSIGDPGLSDSTINLSIVALNASTGEPLWETTHDDNEVGSNWGQLLIVEDVLVHAGSFSAIAYDPDSGEELWEVPVEPVLLPQQSEYYTIARPLAWQQKLVLIDGNLHARVLEPATGDVISEFDFPNEISDSFGANYEFRAEGDSIVVVATLRGHLGPEIIVLHTNPATGEVVHELSISEQQPNEVVYRDSTVAVMVSEWESRPWYLRLFGADGTTRVGVVWMDVDSGEEILRTEMTETDAIYAGAIVNTGEMVCYSTGEFMCFDRAGTRYLTGLSENGMGAYLDGDDIFLTTEDGLIRVKLP